MKQNIRKVQANDIDALKAFLDSSERFPSELLEGMIADYFNKPNSQDIWFTVTEDKIPQLLIVHQRDLLRELTTCMQ